MSKLMCEMCGEEINKDSDYVVLDDERAICEDCRDEYCGQCCICEKTMLYDEMEPWGDVRICQDCLEEICPSFKQEDNERDTQEAYETMLKRYVGKKVLNADEVDQVIVYDLVDPCVTYRISIDIDKNGCIMDISRLSADLLLAEWVNGSKWRSYPIRNEDYTTVVEAMLDDYEFEE